MSQDVRWIQRFSNYAKALIELQEAVKLSKTRGLSKLEKQGLIQYFEYTYELAWKALKDFFENQGITDLFEAKDTIREAFKSGLITDGKVWMQMIKSRNLTSHLYDQKILEEIAKTVVDMYFTQFQLLNEEFSKLQKKEEAL